MLKALLIITMTIFFASCGQDSNNSSDDPSGSNPPVSPASDKNEFPKTELFASEADLPTCTTELEGWLVYVTDIGFKHCTSSAWVAVDIQGPAGPQGDKGEAGASGAAGSKGDPGSGGGAHLVKTAGDQEIGVTDLDGLIAVSAGLVTILFDDGFYANIKGTTGEADSGGYAGCMFLTNDCTGTCYAKKGIQVFEDPAGDLKRAVDEATTNRAIESTYDGDACADTALNNFDVVSVTAYAVPGVAYPFAAPLVVE
jgi:hypothetical protein